MQAVVLLPALVQVVDRLVSDCSIHSFLGNDGVCTEGILKGRKKSILYGNGQVDDNDSVTKLTVSLLMDSFKASTLLVRVRSLSCTLFDEDN
jgi:hypothetical protein